MHFFFVCVMYKMPERVTPPAGSIGEAVNVFFDRLSDTLPVWVSKKWAYFVSVLVAVATLVIAWPSIQDLKATATTPVEKSQWMATLLLAVILATVLQSKVMDLVYDGMVATVNKQHITNIHWLREYATSMRACSPSLLVPGM